MSEDPYAAPKSADLLGDPEWSDADVRAVRDGMRITERLLLSIGVVYAGAGLAALVGAYVFKAYLLEVGGAGVAAGWRLHISILLGGLGTAFLLAGYALYRLRTWALVASYALLLALLIGLLLVASGGRLSSAVAAAFVVLMALPCFTVFSRAARFVLSPVYAGVVERTPAQRPRAWPLAIALLVVLSLLVFLYTVGAPVP